MIKNSSEGFSWTPSTGFVEGLPTIGVVDPPQRIRSNQDDIYDVIIVGAGYAGLIASRDLSTQGKKTLLLEGRDRLGGRTWNASIDGFNYEMGGTWMHWHMPHIYREISLYGLENDWVVTQNPGSRLDYSTLCTNKGQLKLSHEDEAAMYSRVFALFCNSDGDYLRHSWKYAFGTDQSPELIAKLDKMSCQDRLDEIRDELSTNEMTMLVAILQQMGGAEVGQIGYVTVLLWWVLGGHTALGLNDIALHTRLGSGNSTLHRRIFDHAVSTGQLSYSFSTPVMSIQEANDIMTVRSRQGQAWRAAAVICTVPLNVLTSIQFDPPLPPTKVEAARQGQVNKCNKIHFEVKGSDLLSWTSLGSPGKGFVSAFGDGLTPANNTHVVAFGPDPDARNGIHLRNIDSVQKALRHLAPQEGREIVVERIVSLVQPFLTLTWLGLVPVGKSLTDWLLQVSHDWNADEFARGAWCMPPPDFVTKYLKALQLPHGNVWFANADWSDGWRGWIDGAVQIGAQTAHQVVQAQHKFKKRPEANESSGNRQHRGGLQASKL
ncbi:Amino-oxidase domain-containing protein [Fusarium falciforme]|uniref:Amino-oxidase domain-containing protein n=1 Tax=Fusarium falciforme TaxID=195108 RepID=UPI00230002F6|nr:Amino-oxidase domain-containing protein [Fusarium falciforme]WAO90189.1 Amino-oxidase domain-containing protein [Fusarium falciforme]